MSGIDEILEMISNQQKETEEGIIKAAQSKAAQIIREGETKAQAAYDDYIQKAKQRNEREYENKCNAADAEMKRKILACKVELVDEAIENGAKRVIVEYGNTIKISVISITTRRHCTIYAAVIQALPPLFHQPAVQFSFPVAKRLVCDRDDDRRLHAFSAGGVQSRLNDLFKILLFRQFRQILPHAAAGVQRFQNDVFHCHSSLNWL